ncbi:MAG: NAD(P)/FAD-dependent oxidoreductase, partial [Acidimicrobiales bacterium]
DVLDALLGAGVLRLPVDLGDGPDDSMLCSRRLVCEATLHRSVEREPSVTLRTGTGVKDLSFSDAPIPVARGVQLEDGDHLNADLVVDASGRRSPTPRLLAQRGLRPMPEMAQQCGFLYISRHYRLRTGADYPRVDVPILANLGWASALAFPGDSGTFSLLAIVAVIDPLRRELVTEEVFSRFHAAIPLMAPWLEVGEPISEIRTMARVENRYRRLVDDDGPIVGGMVLLGDSALHTNPTAGRGASLAFAHAQHLADSVERLDSPMKFMTDFDEWTGANIGAWYFPQAAADASLVRRMEAAVRNEELPPPDQMEQMRAIMVTLAKVPGPDGLPFRQMMNLVALPAEVIGNPDVLAKAQEFMSGESSGAVMGPARAAFAAEVAPSCRT